MKTVWGVVMRLGKKFVWEGPCWENPVRVGAEPCVLSVVVASSLVDAIMGLSQSVHPGVL
jgi:hypothetical protein